VGVELDVMPAGGNGADRIPEWTRTDLGNGRKQALQHKAGLETVPGEGFELISKPYGMTLDLAIQIPPHVGRQTVLLPMRRDGEGLCINGDEDSQHANRSLRPPDDMVLNEMILVLDLIWGSFHPT
jgi:hypothetical protein